MHSSQTPLLKKLKFWARSGSIDFAMGADGKHSEKLDSFQWRRQKVYFRPGTGDVDLLHRILLKPVAKQEYQFPRDLKPKVILDIGANIGATTVLLRDYYPEARILAFEPEAGNFNVLKATTAQDSGIEVFNLALGEKNETRSLVLEDDALNRGGFSFHHFGKETLEVQSVEVRNLQEFLLAHDIAAVDLLKIDTEGAEFEILKSLDASVLKKVQWICGELHGINDFKLLEYLDHYFDLGVEKSWFNRLAIFQGVRRDLSLAHF